MSEPRPFEQPRTSIGISKRELELLIYALKVAIQTGQPDEIEEGFQALYVWLQEVKEISDKRKWK